MKRYKYPRTYHFPFSPGATVDDKIFNDYEKYFENKRVAITEKMDGENTTVYKDFCHARSIDSKHKEYHSWLLNYIKSFQYKLKDNERICGEYLFAKHSIHYEKLPSYFLVFSIWEDDKCLSWKDTITRCEELNLITVPSYYEGEYNFEELQKWIDTVVINGGEGVVMRLSDSFSYNNFSTSLVKYVRANHVQTNKHWSNQMIIKNGLIK